MKLNGKVHNLLGRLLPEPLQRRPVRLTLSSGIEVCIDSEHTLHMFLELFVTQPYAAALEAAAPVRTVVDLGSNQGLFMLFACHYLRTHGGEVPRFVCVEPARANVQRWQHHAQANGLTGNALLIQGVATGRRNGSVHFYFHPRAPGIGHIVNRQRWTTEEAPVIDLAKAAVFPTIDLLKMDVEGSEQAILQEYPDVLARTRVLVAEFHLEEIDYGRCREMLEASGLLFHRRTFAYKDKLCVEIYRRNGQN